MTSRLTRQQHHATGIGEPHSGPVETRAPGAAGFGPGLDCVNRTRRSAGSGAHQTPGPRPEEGATVCVTVSVRLTHQGIEVAVRQDDDRPIDTDGVPVDDAPPSSRPGLAKCASCNVVPLRRAG